jgi:hypothetical protein
MKVRDTKHLYEVRLERGRGNPKWMAFREAVESLGGKAPDYGGMNNTAIVSTHHDTETLKVLVTGGMRDSSDITVEEITAKTLMDQHTAYRDLVEKYFTPYDNYPAI